MKKLIPIFLLMSIILSFTGCKNYINTNKYVEAAKEYGYMHIFNSSWGMSIDECLKANKLERKDVEILEYVMDESTKREYFVINGQFFDQEVRIGFNFYTYTYNNTKLGLSQIGIELSKPVERDIAREKTLEFLKKADLNFETEEPNAFLGFYENTTTLNKLTDQDVAKKAVEFMSKVYYRQEFTEEQKEAHQFALDKMPDRTLDSYVLYSDLSKGIGRGATDPIVLIQLEADTALYLSNSLFDE